MDQCHQIEILDLIEISWKEDARKKALPKFASCLWPLDGLSFQYCRLTKQSANFRNHKCSPQFPVLHTSLKPFSSVNGCIDAMESPHYHSNHIRLQSITPSSGASVTLSCRCLFVHRADISAIAVDAVIVSTLLFVRRCLLSAASASPGG
eukprot:7958302-Pyramimonas_sp.AAC.2